MTEKDQEALEEWWARGAIPDTAPTLIEKVRQGLKDGARLEGYSVIHLEYTEDKPIKAAIAVVLRDERDWHMNSGDRAIAGYVEDYARENGVNLDE